MSEEWEIAFELEYENYTYSVGTQYFKEINVYETSIWDGEVMIFKFSGVKKADKEACKIAFQAYQQGKEDGTRWGELLLRSKLKELLGI